MIWICHLSNFISWNVGDFTWPGVVEFLWTAKLKKGIKNLSSVPVNVVKRPLGIIFHVVVVQLSLMDRAEVSFLVVNPAVVFTFSLPLCTLFCFCSLVTFRKCRVALPMATLHSCKLSLRWTLLDWIYIIIHSSASELLVRGQSTVIICKILTIDCSSF